jgi:type I restriction enzyme S subunit
MGDVLSDPLANGRSVRTRPGGFPVLRLTAVRDGRIDVRATKPGDWTESDAAKHVVHDGDFLIIRGNGSLSLVGRGGLVEREPVNPVAYPDTLIRARVRRDICEPHFLRLVWDSSVVRRQVEKTARTTAGIYKINQEDLAGLLLPLPSIAEQQDRTASAERRLSLLDALHEQVEVVRRRAGSLRRSLLACAFSGSLVKREGGH